MPFKKGNPYRFTSTRQPERNNLGGRKPSELSSLLALGEVISGEDYRKGLSYLLRCTRAELQAVAESDTLPTWLVARARALYNQSGKFRTEELHDTEERIYGKPKQTTDLTNSDGSLHTPSLVIETVKPAEK